MNTTQKTISFSAYPGAGVEITRATATVFQVTENEPILLTTTQPAAPQFQLSLPIVTSYYYYIVLKIHSYRQNNVEYQVNGKVSLLAVFDGAADAVYISSKTTVACAYCFARMIGLGNGDDILISGQNRRIAIAYAMKNNFVHVDNAVSKVISSSPNGLESNSYPLFNFLANLVYYNLTDQNVYKEFIDLTIGTSPSESFFRAFMYLVHHPFTNVPQIYQLISNLPQIVNPSLPNLILPEGKSAMPDQWTLTIKANDSGAQNFLIAGTAFVVFDKEDKAWIANNTRQGSPNSGTHCIVLNKDASPATISPVFGGGILGTGFGIGADPTGELIAIGNFGWGEELNNPQTGSVSVFTYDGKAVTGGNGHTNLLSRVQGLCYDKFGNLWMASVGQQTPFAPGPDGVIKFPDQNSAVVVYPGGREQDAVSYSAFNGIESPFHSTFDVVMDEEGNAYVSNIGSAKNSIPSSVHKFKLENNQLVCLASWTSDWPNPASGEIGYEELRQVTVRPNGDVFVVAITSSRVIKFDRDLNYIREFTNHIYAPWGITFDKTGVMFVANFGHENGRNTNIRNTLDMTGSFGVTVIENEEEITAKLMSLPTGGDEVTLRNGYPLYGNNQTEDGGHLVCYEPLMRLTASSIDGAGNLWAMNNWKPAATIDVASNPGGDGVVIFIGVAEPS